MLSRLGYLSCFIDKVIIASVVLRLAAFLSLTLFKLYNYFEIMKFNSRIIGDACGSVTLLSITTALGYLGFISGIADEI